MSVTNEKGRTLVNSVDKLREYAACNCRVKGWKDDLKAFADGIEAEVESEYMKLPVDADGVPIRPGDKLIGYNERFDVEGVGDGIVIFRAEDDELGELFNPAATIHVKPRTLEDVLMDAGVSIAAISDVAAEIRELLGGDAE